MQSYIQTLIDISRAAVSYQLHIESIDLPAFMQHLFGYMESLCQTKEIRLQMNTVSRPPMLKFDRVLIERAIMNVISNGLDYSPQGGTLYVDVQDVYKRQAYTYASILIDFALNFFLKFKTRK